MGAEGEGRATPQCERRGNSDRQDRTRQDKTRQLGEEQTGIVVILR